MRTFVIAFIFTGDGGHRAGSLICSLIGYLLGNDVILKGEQESMRLDVLDYSQYHVGGLCCVHTRLCVYLLVWAASDATFEDRYCPAFFTERWSETYPNVFGGGAVDKIINPFILSRYLFFFYICFMVFESEDFPNTRSHM